LVKRDQSRARKLLDAGASPNGKDRFGVTPLGEAIAGQLSAFAELLVEKGADVNLIADDKGSSPLMLAAWYCDLQTARLLLNHGAKTDHKDQDGDTPLSSAADACKNGEMIKLLLSFKAQPDTKNVYGTTPLMAAASSQNVPAVRELLQAGADVTAKNNRGETAAQKACGRGAKAYGEICALLQELPKKPISD